MFGRSREEDLDLEEPRRDREVTLGPAMLLGIFFGLVLLCGLIFGWGYTAGRRSASSMAPKITQTPTGQTLTAPPGGSLSKPMAKGTIPSAPPQPTFASISTPTADGTAGGNPLTSYAPTTSAASAAVSQPQVHTALPPQTATTTANVPAPAPQVQVQPAVPQGPQLMVQVAAVSRMDDANVLMNALRKRGYSVMARRGFSDNLIHVQIGPFTNRAEANAMSQRLLNDGYNATVLQ